MASSLYATHIYPNIGRHRTPPESEITVIDARQQIVRERRPLPNVAGVFHVAFSRDGRLGIACQLRPKNLIPLAHVEHGWVFGEFADGVRRRTVGRPVVQILIDELERYLHACLSASPSRRTRAPRISRPPARIASRSSILRRCCVQRALSRKRHDLANDLSASAQLRCRRAFRWAARPKGIALSPDGAWLYVANRMDDTVSVIDTAARKVVRTIEMGGPSELTPNAAASGYSSMRASPSTADSVAPTATSNPPSTACSGTSSRTVSATTSWTTGSLEDIDGTEPFKWNGGNPDLETECGPRTEKYLLPFAELHRRGTGRPGGLHQVDSAAP